MSYDNKGRHIVSDQEVSIDKIVGVLQPLVDRMAETEQRLGKTEGVLEQVVEGLRDTNRTIARMAETFETRAEKLEERSREVSAPKYNIIISLVGLIIIALAAYLRGPLNEQEQQREFMTELQKQYNTNLQQSYEQNALIRERLATIEAQEQLLHAK